MIYRGMIFQFDSTQGTGLIMLSDGAKKEFSAQHWADASNAPAVGMEISYDSSADIIKIKVLDAEEKSKILLDEKRKKEESTNFRSIDEYRAYYSKKGFDIIKNADESADNKLSMGKLSDESAEVVSITFTNAQPELSTQTIHLSCADDHIKYCQDIGYRLLNDSDDGKSRKATLRRYLMDQHSEIIIMSSDAKVTVTKTINGKKVD